MRGDIQRTTRCKVKWTSTVVWSSHVCLLVYSALTDDLEEPPPTSILIRCRFPDTLDQLERQWNTEWIFVMETFLSPLLTHKAQLTTLLSPAVFIDSLYRPFQQVMFSISTFWKFMWLTETDWILFSLHSNIALSEQNSEYESGRPEYTSLHQVDGRASYSLPTAQMWRWLTRPKALRTTESIVVAAELWTRILYPNIIVGINKREKFSVPKKVVPSTLELINFISSFGQYLNISLVLMQTFYCSWSTVRASLNEATLIDLNLSSFFGLLSPMIASPRLQK